MHSCFGPARAEGRAVQRFADRVAADSGGALGLTVMPFGSSGVADADLLGAVSAGRPPIGTLYAEYFDRDAPDLALCYVQGVLAEPAQHWRIQPLIDEAYRRVLARFEIAALGSLARPVYDACLFAAAPVASLDDLAGRTVRVWSRHQVASFARLGVAARIVPQHAMVAALGDGSVDVALYMAEAAATATGLAAVAPYASSLYPFSAVPNMIGAGRRSLDALPDRLAETLIAAGRWIEAATLTEATAAPAAELGPGFIRAAALPEADRAAFRAASLAAWDEMAAAAGPAALALREGVRAIVA
jgi:TRAP-type C4-dicarboxylate transport system substrate-binding protein